MTQLKLHTKPVTAVQADAVGVIVLEGLRLSASGDQIDGWLGNELSRALKAEDFRIKPGRTFVYYASGSGVKKVICAAMPGPRTAASLRDASCAIARRAAKHGVGKLAVALDPRDAGELQAVAEGALLATYKFEEHKSKKSPGKGLTTILVQTERADADALSRAEAHVQATCLVRDLVNEPAKSLRPQQLAERATKIAREAGLKCRVFETAELERMGARMFLCVGKGSEAPARMIELTYEPAVKPVAHVALVGKGVTFDSGGLSLKPETAMEHMKSDMTGAAVVLACLRGAAQLKLPVKVTGLMMAVENMPDGGANRPGDVVRAMNGKTVEITNTDAEGRLALGDGLTYAQQLKPDYLIDIATLTGAQVVSLGRLIGAVMGNNDMLAAKIMDAGRKSGEFMWQLPMPELYKDLMKSDIADIKNSSGVAEAGSIQGGLFLSEFVDHPCWAHMDISGPSWQEREWSVHSRAASGVPARCILTFLSDLR